jgi:hypothetical protein
MRPSRPTWANAGLRPRLDGRVWAGGCEATGGGRVFEPESLYHRLRDEATARQYQEAAALLT